MSPKSLLRHKENVSTLEDMGPSHSFKRVLSERQPDYVLPNEDIKRVILCTGRVYYDLRQERKERDRKDVALITLEQLSPFPFTQVIEDLKKYPNAEIMWCQEEPLNMGGWSYVEPRLITALRKSMDDQRVPT